MLDVLPVPLPWYIVGPLMGLVIVGLYASTNKHFGITGSYVQMVSLAKGLPVEAWRLWLLGGTLAGATLVAILGESPQAGLRYGALGELLPLGALVGVLFSGGLLIGFGARWAGGCTSGHGLSGCATRSPGSLVAIMTFMVTAVGVTLLMHMLTGGRL